MHVRSIARLRIAVVGAFLALCASCASQQALPRGDGAYVVETGHEYKLGPGDKLRVTVFAEDNLSGEFTVSNNGGVALPLVGEVRAGGVTPTDFQTAVQQKLAETGMVRTPRVSVDVLSYRPFYILGEVNDPGQYPYAIGMTVTKAVATAGGFTYRANDRMVYVTREGSTREDALWVTAASWIGPGDTIRVSERTF